MSRLCNSNVAQQFELPKTTRVDDQDVIVSDASFEVIYKGVATARSKGDVDLALRGFSYNCTLSTSALETLRFFRM